MKRHYSADNAMVMVIQCSMVLWNSLSTWQTEMGLEIFLFNLAESVIRYWPDTV